MSITPEEVACWAREAWENGPPTTELTPWTIRMNAFLAEQAHARGLQAFGKALGTHNGEYLVDHCWHAPWKGMRNYAGLEFAAEFEWQGTRPAIEEDLVKLADVRAKVRLFVGNLWQAAWEHVEELASDAAAMLSRHMFARDDWLVLALGPKGRAEETEDLRIWKISESDAKELKRSQ